MCGVWEQFETISQLKDHNIDTQYKLGTACLGYKCQGGGGVGIDQKKKKIDNTPRIL